ncbi:hypothetical protein JTE90_020351 [Oedothorax gibbosus]|uniref:ABC transmembrane type-1 domain-containing protein n=1 Tax=Oedothorax gibbosus TaxID=931172 RepID=A0AAV6TP79_9ARAC|nr:hypothetical protein JTE90_020351 [Oedothorax gibbosus]
MCSIIYLYCVPFDVLKSIIMADSSYFSSSSYSNASYGSLGRDALNLYFQYQTVLWTALLMAPIVATLLLPVVMLALVYISALYLGKGITG